MLAHVVYMMFCVVIEWLAAVCLIHCTNANDLGLAAYFPIHDQAG